MGTRVQDRKYIKILLYLRKGKIKHEKKQKKVKNKYSETIIIHIGNNIMVLGNIYIQM